MSDVDATRSKPPSVTDERALREAVAASAAPPAIGDVFEDEPERYAVAGAIGAGGMGTVLAATSARLGRPVALKVVTADREDLRRRFEREAQVTARLQHPAIVPVYGVGRRNGQPFYAMKHVTGEPLDKVIAKATGVNERIALLPKVIAVTEAIAYAHSEHVIHRDLKPANILAGEYGETVVIDWGLAKDLRAADADPDAAPAERTGATAPTADATAHGKVMGTPAYMPLEQARGEPLDERADVYALGAILYHVLAGLAPYRRPDEDSAPWESMLARVIAGPPAPLGDDVPPDLRAIVQRAMARAASERYPSAGELAADLKRFQTGQLVGAHRYSGWQLVRRWLRRHRAAVTVAAALLVVLGAVSAISVQRIRRERSDAEAARAVADEQRALAVTSRNEAEDLMGFMLGDLKDKLQPVGKLDILDAVAKKAMAYYQHQSDTGSPAEREKRALAFTNVGDVLQAQGNLDGALGAYRSGLAIRARLASAPASYLDQGDAASSHYKIGDVLDYQGNPKDALVEYRAGLELAQRAAAGRPADLELQRRVATGLSNIGDILRDQGDLDGALAEYRKALAIREPIAKAQPHDARALRNVGVSYASIGYIEGLRGNVAGAKAALGTSKALLQQTLAMEPSSAEWKRDLTVPIGRLGDVLLQDHDIAGALVEYRGALALADELVARDPTNTGWLRDDAISHHNLANALAATHDDAATVAEYRRSIEISDQLTKLDSANAQWKRDLAQMHQALGGYLRDRAKPDDALAEYAAARAIIEALAAADPSSVVYLNDLAALHNMVGNVLGNENDPAKTRASLPEFQAAAAAFAAIVKKLPASFEYRKRLADSLENLGENQAAVNDPAAAETLHKALALFETLAKEQPSNHDLDSSELVNHFDTGQLIEKAQPDAALAEYRAAKVIADHLVAADPKNGQWQSMQSAVAKQLETCCKQPRH